NLFVAALDNRTEAGKRQLRTIVENQYQGNPWRGRVWKFESRSGYEETFKPDSILIRKGRFQIRLVAFRDIREFASSQCDPIRSLLQIANLIGNPAQRVTEAPCRRLKNQFQDPFLVRQFLFLE